MISKNLDKLISIKTTVEEDYTRYSAALILRSEAKADNRYNFPKRNNLIKDRLKYEITRYLYQDKRDELYSWVEKNLGRTLTFQNTDELFGIFNSAPK